MASNSPTPDQLKELLKLSKDASENSYSPYSQFKVGAALLTKDGTFYGGCNVENASYGLAICAERTAMVKAVSAGHKEFIAIAIYGEKMEKTPIRPCGACRQFMAEFGLKWEVYMLKNNLSYEKNTVEGILPNAFVPPHLNENN